MIFLTLTGFFLPSESALSSNFQQNSTNSSTFSNETLYPLPKPSPQIGLNQYSRAQEISYPLPETSPQLRAHQYLLNRGNAFSRGDEEDDEYHHQFPRGRKDDEYHHQFPRGDEDDEYHHQFPRGDKGERGTHHQEVEARNYVAYIPVPISDEDDEEYEEDEYYDDEDEEEKKEDDEEYYYDEGQSIFHNQTAMEFC